MKILALGSNLSFENSSPKENIEKAYEALIKKEIKILKKSLIYKSEAYPNKNDPEFCNSAISIDTNLSPDKLLSVILEIEETYGRKRYIKNSPRTLDIDIISFDDQIIDEENLKIPHPHIQKRLFVLFPVLDLDKNWKHPQLLKSAEDMIKEFDQKSLNSVKRFS